MPTLHRIANVRIAIYADDHGPPHFHVVGPDFEAQIRIADLHLMRGHIAPKLIRSVLDWARINRAALALKWVELNTER